MTVSFFRRVACAVLFLFVLAGLVWTVQTVPEWQVWRAGVRSAPAKPEATSPAEVANIQNEMRKTFLQVVGGAFAIFALYLTYRRVKVAEQGHITDRYTKAIEQLGAMKTENRPNVEVRLGAIYALERIALDSPRDHWTIMEVLTAYVRQNAPKPAGDHTAEDDAQAIAMGPATEIQAILTVLGRRQDLWREQNGQRLDLRDSDLRGVSLFRAHLEGALFFRAQIKGASFYHAHVEGARFSMAHVEGADFYGAHAERTRFYGAHVEGANFGWASVEGARFDGAQLEGASFYHAHVEGASFLNATGLAVEQIRAANGWEAARFDEEFLRKLIIAKGKDSGPGKAIA